MTFPLEDNDDLLFDEHARMERLLHELGHLDRAMREQAVRQLIEMGAEAVPALLRVVSDPFSRGRSGALRALGAIGDDRALPMLLELLTAEDELLRANAAFALSNFAGEQVAAALERSLHDSKARVRRAAAEALAHLQPGKALALGEHDAAIIAQHVSNLRSRAPFAREQAIQKLIAIGAPAVADVMGMLSADEAFARRAAIAVLHGMKAADARSPLQHIAAADPDAMVRQAALVALAALSPAGN